MKICQSSNNFNKLINCILDDNLNIFLTNLPSNLNGKIDNKPFINFCLESDSKEILKNIIRNQNLITTSKINKETFMLLSKTKTLNSKEKTYIYMNLIKNKIKIPSKLFLKMAISGNNIVYKWIDFKPNNKEVYYVISNGLDKNKLQLIKKNKNYLSLIVNSVGFYGLEIENYLDLLEQNELIKVLNKLFSFSKLHKDINTIDSIIEILKKKPYLIDKVDKNLLYFLKEFIQEDFFMFLKNDIDKIILLKKLSNLSIKEKNHVTKI